MRNLLITYAGHKKNGFRNNFYILSDHAINIDEIQDDKEYALLIPYDYKNQIEPYCFKKKSTFQTPLIFPVVLKKSFSNLMELRQDFHHQSIHQKTKSNQLIYEQTSAEEYKRNFLKIQEYLKNGDIYEINYCIPFVLKNITLNPYQLFFDVADVMQMPFTALFKYNEYFIISFSPERFLKKIDDTLYTEPIKGTSKRGFSKEEDIQLKKELQQSLKERTENAMTVDVCRNDLSRIAQKGTVKADDLFCIKTYPTVHQMHSKVSCKIKTDIKFKDIIHACFPMASMTGAPKIRAMQIAEELENYPREFYSGTLGVFDKDNFDLSVLIRTIFYDREKNELKVWAGSAITLNSDPEKEYEECLLKIKFILQSIKKYIL